MVCRPDSFGQGSLSFSTTLQATTTSAGTVTTGAKESQGAAAGRSRWRRWPSRAKPCAGGTPALPGRPHPTTSLFPLKRGVIINIGTKSQAPSRPSAHPSRTSSNPFVALRRSSVESRTGALTIGSGGVSVAFASGLSPAPLSRFQSPLSEPDVRFSRISALQWDHASRTQVPGRIRGRLLRGWHSPLLHPLPLPGCRQAC